MLETKKDANLTPASSTRPIILFVEDNPGEARPTIRGLCQAGYDVVHVGSTESAGACLHAYNFAFVIVDGGLEDGRRDAKGAAARFISNRLDEISYGRLTNEPGKIPLEFRGKFCLCKKYDMDMMLAELAKLVPIAPSLSGPGSVIQPDLSQISGPAIDRVAIVVPPDKIDAVDEWLKDKHIPLLKRSERMSYLAVPDMPDDFAEELSQKFNARIVSEKEFRRQFRTRSH